MVSTGYLYKLSHNLHKTYVKPGYSTKVLTNYNTLDAYHLFTIASACSSTGLAGRDIPAASTLTFEVYSDNTVKAYLNDVKFTPTGCLLGQTCYAIDFVNALYAKTTRTDYKTHC